MSRPVGLRVSLTDEHAEQIRRGQLRVRVDLKGRIVVTDPATEHVGIGATPRQAIDDLKNNPGR